MGLSIISRPAGMMPAAMMLATARPASATLEKLAMMQRAAGGRGRRRTSTRVTTPSSPSLPTKPASRSSPGASSASDPRVKGSPSMLKPCRANTLCSVNPYLRQCTPPAFSATLPPMVQAIWLLGSGA
jgi:hypothetical protein